MFAFWQSCWQSCRIEEKTILLLCGAVLIFCAGAEWSRRQKEQPALFYPPFVAQHKPSAKAN